MTDRHEALDQLRSANPVPAFDLIDPDEMASVATLCEERRLTPTAAKQDLPAAAPRRGLRKPVLAFATAFAAVVAAIGVFALVDRDHQGAIEEPFPVATISPVSPRCAGGRIQTCRDPSNNVAPSLRRSPRRPLLSTGSGVAS